MKFTGCFTSTQPYHLLKSFYLESFWWLCFYFKPEISLEALPFSFFASLALDITHPERGLLSSLGLTGDKKPKRQQGVYHRYHQWGLRTCCSWSQQGYSFEFKPRPAPKEQPSLILGMSSWTFSHMNQSKSTVTVSSRDCFQLIKWKSFRKLFLILWLSVEEHGREMLTFTIWTTRWLRAYAANRTASRCSASPLKSVKNKCKILVAIKAVLHDFTFQWY